MFCESGATTNHTRIRSVFVPTTTVISELRSFFDTRQPIDCITFSGSGEPSLAQNIGEIIAHIKTTYPEYPVCVLTNGSLLWDPEVRTALREADIVVPSLHAAEDSVFAAIAQPVQGLSLSQIIQGLMDFRTVFSHKLIIEVFIVPGLNDSAAIISGLKAALTAIQPDGIQLNALDRPGTREWVIQANGAALQQIADQLQPLPVTIVSSAAHIKPSDSISASQTDKQKTVLNALMRRPCTCADLTHMLGLGDSDIQIILNDLISKNQVRINHQPRGVFYQLV